MAQVSITQLPQAQALDGTESVPIVQGGVTVQTTTGAISGAGALNYPFLTVGSTAGLTQARFLAVGSGLTLVDNGAGFDLQINMTGAAASLNTSGTGIQVKTGPNTLTARQITVGGGMTITDGDGIAGNPLIGLDTQLQNLSALSGVGLMTINGSTFSQTSILGTTNQVDVANGNAAGGSPTISLASNPVLPGNGAVTVPSGTSGQRQDGNGNLRYNTTLARFEGYQGGAWTSFGVGDGTVTSVSGVSGQIAVTNPTTTPIIGLATNPSLPGTGSVLLPQGTTAQRSAAGFGALRYNTDTASLEAYTQGIGWGAIISGTGVTTFSGGMTGLTPNTPTSGGIVLGGILGPTYGGTGVNNGSYTVTLGGNITTAGSFTTSGAYALTLTTTSPTSITLPTTGTLATLAGSETLTNKTISGSNNTLTNIGNSSLTNSSVTYNGVTVALGGSGTITATTTAALTVSTGLQLNSGTTFDGSVAKTISIDSTVVTLNDPQTLTNKSISGSSNTLSNIGNSSLTNSSTTFNGVTVALGSSGTITAVNPYALTIGTGLSGTSYDGAGAVTIAIANTGVTAASYGGASKTLTATVNAQGQLTALAETPIAISYTQVSGLGTAATLNAGVAGGVATLDGGGQVPLSQLPTAIQGALSYQGSWNALTNTPTLTSSVGTKGYFYIVSVAGTTNLNGITDWQVGDWAVFNGSIWQKIDNTDAVTSVNGYTGAVVLSYSDVGAPSTSGTNATGTWGISISGNAATVTNGVYTTGSYADPTWITSLATSKLSGTVAVANGGTNIASYTVGDMLWASGATTLSKLAIGTATYIMTSSGSAPQWSAPSTLLVGTALALAGGVAGDLPYQSASGVTSFLNLGTSGYVLTAGASAPQYVAQSTLSVGSATNATNATNTAITANSANATNYLTFVSATSGNLPQLVNSSITCNPSTGQITGGIAGGAF